MIGEGGVSPPQCRYGNLKSKTLESPNTNYEASPEQESKTLYQCLPNDSSSEEFFYCLY